MVHIFKKSLKLNFCLEIHVSASVFIANVRCHFECWLRKLGSSFQRVVHRHFFFFLTVETFYNKVAGDIEDGFMPTENKIGPIENNSGLLKTKLGLLRISLGLLKTKLGLLKIILGLLKIILGLSKMKLSLLKMLGLSKKWAYWK